MEQPSVRESHKFSDTSSIVNKETKVKFEETAIFLDNCDNFLKDDIENMLDSGIDIDCSDSDNLTALHRACIKVKNDLVLYLLLKNADINKTDKEGWTPLHIAACIGSLELSKCLIDNGARLDMVNYDGNLPVSLVDESHNDLKIFFLKEMEKRNINEIYCRNLERSVMMVDITEWRSSGIYKPPIDYVNKSTPLHVAASKNYLDVIVELIPLLKKRELNAQDRDGWTSLHVAAHWGNREACMLLIKAGADASILTRAGETVLEIANPLLKDELKEAILNSEIKVPKLNDIHNTVSIDYDSIKMERPSLRLSKAKSKQDTKHQDIVKERKIFREVSSNSESSDELSLSNDKAHTPKSMEASVPSKNEVIKDNKVKEDVLFNVYSPTGRESNNGDNFQSNNLFTSSNNALEKNSIVQSDKIGSPRLLNGDNNSIATGDGLRQCDIEKGHSIDNVVASDTHVESESSSDCEKSSTSVTKIVKVKPKKMSLVMAPSKCDESETSRREKSRHKRTTKRATQGLDLKAVNTALQEQKQLTSSTNDELVLRNTSDVKDSPTVEKCQPDNQPNLQSDNATPMFSTIVPKVRIERQLSRLMSQRSTSITQHSDQSAVDTEERFATSDPNKATINNKYSTEFKEASIDRTPAVDNGDMMNNSDIDSLVSAPLAKMESVDIITPNSSEISGKDLSNIEIQNSAQSDLSKFAFSIGTVEENQTCKAIALRMLSDETIKKELQIEISKLKEKIHELEHRKDNVDSANTNPKNQQTKLNSGGDRISNLEMDLIKTKEENKKLKLQNEALLRVISKIQEELEAFHSGSSHE